MLYLSFFLSPGSVVSCILVNNYCSSLTQFWTVSNPTPSVCWPLCGRLQKKRLWNTSLPEGRAAPNLKYMTTLLWYFSQNQHVLPFYTWWLYCSVFIPLIFVGIHYADQRPVIWIRSDLFQDLCSLGAVSTARNSEEIFTDPRSVKDGCAAQWMLVTAWPCLRKKFISLVLYLLYTEQQNQTNKAVHCL